jgi:hypothetical protein
MIKLHRRTLLQRLLRLVPAIRRRQDADLLRAAIRRLVDDPDLPCEIDGIFIPNGRGAPQINVAEVTKDWSIH